MKATLSNNTLLLELASGDLHVYSLTGIRAQPFTKRRLDQVGGTEVEADEAAFNYFVRISFPDNSFVDLQMGEFSDHADWTNDQEGQIECVEDIRAAMNSAAFDKGYLEYVVLLTDIGEALSTDVLVNELGGTVIWSGDGGGYEGTLVGAFPVARTTITVGGFPAPDEAGALIHISNDGDAIGVTTHAGGVITGNLLDRAPIIVRVYPAA